MDENKPRHLNIKYEPGVPLPEIKNIVWEVAWGNTREAVRRWLEKHAADKPIIVEAAPDAVPR